MKKILIAVVGLASWLAIPAQAQDAGQPTQTPQRRNPFGRILEQVAQPRGSAAGLSSAEIAQGLREALRVGISKGADQASARDGYYKNQLIRILFPPEAQRVEARLRQLGFDRQVDQFIVAVNRSAEDAAKLAKPIFIEAITSMTIDDAVGILRGGDDAATQYLRRTSGAELVRQFTPVIDSTLEKNQATRYYNELATTYNRLPLVQRVNPNLTQYVTEKAVDGLFVLVAQEEKRIRENPAARATDLLRRVFGSRQ